MRERIWIREIHASRVIVSKISSKEVYNFVKGCVRWRRGASHYYWNWEMQSREVFEPRIEDLLGRVKQLAITSLWLAYCCNAEKLRKKVINSSEATQCTHMNSVAEIAN
jgi:hypothetical protein